MAGMPQMSDEEMMEAVMGSSGGWLVGAGLGWWVLGWWVLGGWVLG